MKKLFDPIKLRENSRERVLRELISYNEIKGKNEKQSTNFQENNKPQRVLKPQKKKKAHIVMEVLAGAAVIAMITGIISISISKSGNTTQPLKNVNSQNVAENSTNDNSNQDNSNQDNSLQGALPASTPVIEFISSETLGVSIAFNRQYLTRYEIDDDGCITLYQSDAGTETGFNWNNIIIRGSIHSYEEEVYMWANDMYDHYYGTLQNTAEVIIGELLSDYLSTIDGYSNASSSDAKAIATKFSFAYELSDINAMECVDVYVIDSVPYNSNYSSYVITVAYQTFYDNNNNIKEYSSSPILIYETLDSLSFTAYTKKTYYLLANGTYTYENSQGGTSELENFSINYADNISSDKYGDSYDAFYSLLTSSDSDRSDNIFKVILPMGHLYDASGTNDINISADFQPTFNNSVAIDLYYPYYGDSDGASDTLYPSYGILHTEFKTDTDYSDGSSNRLSNVDGEKTTVNTDDSVVTTKSFEISPNGDKLISVDDKYCTIYGISEAYMTNTNTDFIYDYVIYVPIEQIYDAQDNSIGKVISDISEIAPPLTMTVYYNGTELETFPAQIYADKIVIYGLEESNVFN